MCAVCVGSNGGIQDEKLTGMLVRSHPTCHLGKRGSRTGRSIGHELCRVNCLMLLQAVLLVRPPKDAMTPVLESCHWPPTSFDELQLCVVVIRLTD
mmetsp:Transcript_36871/g.73530  ORF Transcript_36871/g.73530 Transcript_36871/m.73530 type:complete len:96 (+) Transcript_36871:147-434(+)